MNVTFILKNYIYIKKIRLKIEDFLERLNDPFVIKDLLAKVEEKTPYIIVAIQECERMNNLTLEIKRSLNELGFGLKVKKRNINYLFFSKNVCTNLANLRAS